MHHARPATASVHATYEVAGVHEPQPAARPEPAKQTETENYRAADRARPIQYVPDNLDDIDSEIVRHAEPIEEARKARNEASTIETVSSGVEISYNTDDLEIPAYLRKRGEG